MTERLMSVFNFTWIPLIRTRLFRIPRYFELKNISLGFAPQSFITDYFELFFVSPGSLKLRGPTIIYAEAGEIIVVTEVYAKLARALC